MCSHNATSRVRRAVSSRPSFLYVRELGSEGEKKVRIVNTYLGILCDSIQSATLHYSNDEE